MADDGDYDLAVAATIVLSALKKTTRTSVLCPRATQHFHHVTPSFSCITEQCSNSKFPYEILAFTDAKLTSYSSKYVNK